MAGVILKNGGLSYLKNLNPLKRHLDKKNPERKVFDLNEDEVLKSSLL